MPWILITYSPSAGNSCLTIMPPRVPNGSPTTWAFCDVSVGASYTVCVGVLTLPMARRLILPAADRYASTSAGDIESAPAMLSNPLVESSDGRNLVASTSSASRSRMALAYSTRFRRCRPGGGRWVTAVRSSSSSNQPTSPSSVVGSGRGIPDGGIMPARSFRTTFSAVAASSLRRARFSLSNFKLAVLMVAL